MKWPKPVWSLLFVFFASSAASTAQTNAETELEPGKARLVIEGWLGGEHRKPQPLVFATTIHDRTTLTRDKATQQIQLKLDILSGSPTELPLMMRGQPEIRSVTGEHLQDWSIRRETNGTQTLVLRVKKTEQQPAVYTVQVVAETAIDSSGTDLKLLTLSPPQPALAQGFIRLESSPELALVPKDVSALLPLPLQLLPESLRPELKVGAAVPLAYKIESGAYSLPLRVELADPEARQVVLRDFNLVGTLTGEKAAFRLRATAHVRNPKSASLVLLSGKVALTEIPPSSDWKVRLDAGAYVLVFDGPGDFPIELNFDAAIEQDPGGKRGWNQIAFQIASASVQPFFLRGLAADTQISFPGAARPELVHGVFQSHLPANGDVRLGWKRGKTEPEGKLFYSVEMLSQVKISPGLMRQIALVDVKVMQGDLKHISFELEGAGEVTRIQGEQVLSWRVEGLADAPKRILAVQFNQAIKESTKLIVQVQTPLGAFPQSMVTVKLTPVDATRFAGYYRVVKEGAVRLEVTPKGLSQISPEQFPETEATRSALAAGGSQQFAYRFSGANFSLQIQGDQILPEVTASELLAYRLGETEFSIQAELELDIREAPLREVLLRIPANYGVAQLKAPGLSDYFVHELENRLQSELRLVYGQPISGRQVVELRLERNQAATNLSWQLPPIEVVRAKSVRGHLGISADPGYRLTPERTGGLTEIATAFFPRKVPNLQAAFRISEPAWQASMRVERLPQTIQADTVHLFSIGEGIAYGSSVLNYVISGAPVSAFRVELSEEYYNVEFSGKDVRGWQKTDGGFVVQLHTPVAGTYTLLATYERPFKAQGETLTFTGARPVDAVSEQGYTLVTSAYQFQVQPSDVSPTLLALEPGEVPPEYRLFFDAPLLSAYRYTARPFNLKLTLSPLVQGDSLSQIIDRASLVTRISKEGQVLTEIRYFVKNRGNPNLRLTLPSGDELWSATVDGSPVVPVREQNSNLIPLPQRADPNAVLTLDVKVASRSPRAQRVLVQAPIPGAPVLLGEWKIEADTGRRLIFRKGSLTPQNGRSILSGFDSLAGLFSGYRANEALVVLLAACALIAFSLAIWRSTLLNAGFRFSPRFIAGGSLGILALLLGFGALFKLAELAPEAPQRAQRDLSFLAPIQQGGNGLSIEVSNLPEQLTFGDVLFFAWPAMIGVGLVVYSLVAPSRPAQNAARLAGWMALAWAALRLPESPLPFMLVLTAFILFHLAIPGLRSLWRLPVKPHPAIPPLAGGAAPGAISLLIGTALFSTIVAGQGAALERTTVALTNAPPIASLVLNELTVEGRFVFGTAKISWEAKKRQILPLLFEPAVLMRADFPTNELKLLHTSQASGTVQQVVAEQNGRFEITLLYQLQVTNRDGEAGIFLPIHPGLVNRLRISITNLDVEIASSQAISIENLPGTNTSAAVVLPPVERPWIGWRPRTRDVRKEAPVFYAELAQLFTPVAGLVEAAHYVSIRPAQGELAELSMRVPDGETVSDVTDPAKSPLIRSWRFDPDSRTLRVALNPPQSRPFSFIVRGQKPAGPLPFTSTVGLLTVEAAATQIGTLGVATTAEVQLDNTTVDALTPMNLEDFSPEPGAALQAELPGLTLRRAYQYSTSSSAATFAASAVQPDVRIEAQTTVSLGEDRTVLAVQADVSISRAGIFRLSFVMPGGFEVDSIAGKALSHWTEMRSETGRVVTLHLTGKSEGLQQFAISLAGPGVRATNGWTIPQLSIREAGKQRGSLLLVPEQGMRLQVAQREGLTQLDPKKAGITQKGVVAFSVLQSPWRLAIDVEQVDAWVQVTSLQHASFNEAQVKTRANLQYQIENAGVKTFHVLLPTNAESVHFAGEQISDFLPVPQANTNGLGLWEVKLHRRVIGLYALQITYQTALPERAARIGLRGVLAADVNVQRGFLTLQSAGRLQVLLDSVPEALQATEWQSIPPVLRQNLQTAPANFTFRLVEPAFDLGVRIEQREAAKLLPARVNNITLNSVLADNGVMLTQVRLEIVPGDKRLLNFTLPASAKFWFAFVNQNGVWPWRERDRILLPLEQQSKGSTPVPVEFFYSAQVGTGRPALNLELLAPKFDLPLENVTWRVSLSDKWRVSGWHGTLDLQRQESVPQAAALDLQGYLQKELSTQRERSKEAENYINLGNTALEQGDPQQARRAFQQAFGLSTHDAAFNEDARVQLHNVKIQQALVGLNLRQAAVGGDVLIAGKLQAEGRAELNYTPQQAREILQRNNADDNAALNRLAERLIQQQDAAVSSPAVIRASLPEQPRVLSFQRALAIDPWADLRLELKLKSASRSSLPVQAGVIAAVLLLFGLVYAAGRLLRAPARDRVPL